MGKKPTVLIKMYYFLKNTQKTRIREKRKRIKCELHKEHFRISIRRGQGNITIKRMHALEY